MATYCFQSLDWVERLLGRIAGLDDDLLDHFQSLDWVERLLGSALDQLNYWKLVNFQSLDWVERLLGPTIKTNRLTQIVLSIPRLG